MPATSRTSLESVFRQKSLLVNKALYKMVDTHAIAALKEPALHIMKAGGKRIRPTIALLSCEACGAEQKYALAPALSVELVHTASLIHDDIIDSNLTRRGVQCVHVKYGLHAGILTGDMLLAMGIKALTLPTSRVCIGDMSLSYVSDEIVENLSLFAKAWVTVCDGKRLDIKKDYERINEKKVFDLMYKKAGILFELPARMGATYAGAERKDIVSLAKYGKCVGIAFQIQDDILGLIGDEKKFGKHVGVDIREGKKTLMISHIMANGSKKEKRLVLSAFGDRDVSKEKIEEIVDVIKSHGAIDYAKEHARTLNERAKAQLEILNSSRATTSLRQIADFVINRIW